MKKRWFLVLDGTLSSPFSNCRAFSDIEHARTYAEQIGAEVMEAHVEKVHTNGKIRSMEGFGEESSEVAQGQ